MDSELDIARAHLRAHGLRATEQRIVVLGALMVDPGDTTAQGLYERLRKRHPSLGLATVYRTLGSLADAGIIDAMQHGHGTCYRWCAPGHHHHLTCTGCHRVVEVRECPIGDWAETVGAANGFTNVSHVFEISGRCADCA